MKSGTLKKHQTVEYYINKKLFKAFPYDVWSQFEEVFKQTLRDKGYESVWLDSFRNRIHGDVYLNIDSKKVIIVDHRINTGFCDKHGNRIYEEDVVKSDIHPESELNEHYNGEVYYLRYPSGNSWRDVDIKQEELETFEKVSDCLDIPKSEWKKPKMFNIKEL